MAIIITSGILSPLPIASGHQEPEQKPTKVLFTKAELTDLVYASADRYNANRQEMLVTVLCEAPTVEIDGETYFNSEGQSEHYRNGVREDSWGFPQWNMPAKNYNLEGSPITKEQATDAVYSLDTMALHFTAGYESKTKWTCFRDKFT